MTDPVDRMLQVFQQCRDGLPINLDPRLQLKLGDGYCQSQGAPPTSVACLVGPEGDFTREEVDAALAAGFVPVTLGPYVLRCETAAVAALAAVASELSS